MEREQPSMSEQIVERMTAADFLQLPESMQKIELIAGEVFMPPSPLSDHQRVVIRSLSVLESLVPNGEVLISPMDVVFDDENVFQPDVFWVAEDSQCVDKGANFVGAPDLIVEVLSPGTALKDRREKFLIYEKYGVGEYWLIDPAAATVEVWTLQEERFMRAGIFGKAESFRSTLLNREVFLKDIF